MKRRQKEDKLDFLTVKQAVFSSLELWVAAVDAGETVKTVSEEQPLPEDQD